MNAESVNLYDSSNIDTLPWPNTEDGEYAKKFLKPLIKDGVSHYIDNIDTILMALTIDNIILPITINETEYHNSYVCSPYGFYVRHGLSFAERLSKKPYKAVLKTLLNGLGKVFRAGKINKVVMVNNWLFSTNLYPDIDAAQIRAVTRFLLQRFPHSAIIFRSIHTHKGKELYQSLKQNQFDLIASREVFFINAREETSFLARAFKSDLKNLKESNYELLEHEDIPKEEIQRLTSLYRMVYLDKHSAINPQLNSNFLKLALENQLLYLKALRKEGKIDVVIGFFCRNGTLTSPLLGYDIHLPQELKLYRLASTLLSLEAKKRQMLFHLSSGASFYKKIRKAESSIEYMAVYHRHLPISRRFCWWFLRGIANSIGKTFMKSYDK